VDPFALPSPCDQALLLLRVAARPPDPDSTVRLANIGATARMQVRVLVSRHGFVPLVMTCGSFVTDVAEVVAVTARTSSVAQCGLRPAGDWSTAFRGRRIYTPSGCHWTLYGDDAAA
jgi:hypothetical protein